MLTLRHIGPLIRKQKKANAGLGLLAPLLVHMCVVYAIASVSMSVHARVEARGWHWASSAIALYFSLFWDKISHCSSLGQTGWLVSPQHLPACTLRCWDDRCTPPHSSFTEPSLQHGRHLTQSAISQPSPSPFFFSMRAQSIHYAIHIHGVFHPQVNLSGDILTDTPRDVYSAVFLNLVQVDNVG